MTVTTALLLSLHPALAREDVQALKLHIGNPIKLATKDALSSKAHAKGDMVALRTTADVIVDGSVVIPSGTDATGQVEESQGTGGMGTNGRLTIRPLYLRVANRIVRLTGARSSSGKTKADTVIGMVLLSPLLSGRSAVIPAGTGVDAMVEKSVELTRQPNG